MNYVNIYNSLIRKGLSRELDKDAYYEKHHITPVCLGGSNLSENLVNLTAEEHFVAHQLLVKIYPNNEKLVFAAKAMTMEGRGKMRRVNNKLYGWIRKRLAKAAKTRQSGKKLSEETKRKLSEAMKKHVRTPEHCANIAKSKLGDKNPMKNKTHSEEARLKIGQASKGNTYASKRKPQI